MTIPGLGLTSEGLTKVIDVRDFTGQGDIELTKAEYAEDGRLECEDGLLLEGLDALLQAAAVVGLEVYHLSSPPAVRGAVLRRARPRPGAVYNVCDDAPTSAAEAPGACASTAMTRHSGIDTLKRLS